MIILTYIKLKGRFYIMNLNLALCIIAIIVSIIIGYKFKFNTGIIALGFAFVIGVIAMGMKVNDIIAFFPTTIVFYLISRLL